MTTNTAETVAVKAGSVPMQVLREAVKAVVDTCRIQMDLHLEVDPHPSDPRKSDANLGSSIALTSETGGWSLAVMANQKSCEKLTRILLAMEPDETPTMEDIADGVGEIANVAAGVMKSSRAAAGEKVQLGLPLFMENSSSVKFFASGLRGMAQTVRGEDDLAVHVVLIWHEG